MTRLKNPKVNREVEVEGLEDSGRNGDFSSS
jgi:hypothetical protein